MAASTASAIRDRIATLGLTRGSGPMPVVTRVVPGLLLPYVLVSGLDGGSVRDPMGDYGDQAAMDDGITELLQVEHVRRTVRADQAETDDAVADAIAAGLTGCRLPAAPHHVYGVTCDAVTRVPAVEPNVTRTALTVRVRRSLKRSA